MASNDYASQVIQALDETGAPISAASARDQSSKVRVTSKLNYSLTIRRVFKLIRDASKNGDVTLTFRAPSFVPDGTVGDPILLARQIKAKLVAPDMGYKVERTDDQLVITWEA